MNAKRSRGPGTIGVVLAAGEGLRAGGRKQFREAGGRSVLRHAVDGLCALREIGGVIVVVPEDAIEAVREELDDVPRLVDVIGGGVTRNRSSRNGVAALPDSCRYVLIHDAARPFASPKLIRRVLRAARDVGAAVPAVPVSDSVVELFADGGLRRYLERDRIRAVQTPQAFAREVIEAAFARTRRDDFTDDAGVVRRTGRPVAVVEGDATNVKITSQEDLEHALRLLAPPATVTPLPELPRRRRKKT